MENPAGETINRQLARNGSRAPRRPLNQRVNAGSHQIVCRSPSSIGTFRLTNRARTRPLLRLPGRNAGPNAGFPPVST